MPVYKVLELFSGVGGMHMALQECGVPYELAAAVDVNTTANAIYRHNFPNNKLLQRNIEGMCAGELDKMAADIVVMSPPCQPFSRLGRGGDINDRRCAPLLHLLRQFAQMRRPPTHLLLENVAGFEKSQARALTLATLRQMRLDCREFLLSPSQLAVPNSRTRYYLLARRRPFRFAQPRQDEPLRCLPVCLCRASTSLSSENTFNNNNNSVTTDCDVTGTCSVCGQRCPSDVQDEDDVVTRLQRILPAMSLDGTDTPTLDEFLAGVHPPSSASSCSQGPSVSDLLLPTDQLVRYARLADIVNGQSRRSCCVTGGYGCRIEGAGSLFTCATDHQVAAAFAAAAQSDADRHRRRTCLEPLGLRYFSPAEVARLMCFPAHFDTVSAPVTRRQMYRALGNSVNVRVVSALLTVLIYD